VSLLLAGLAWCAGAAAEEPAESPHGDLTISCAECHSSADWAPLSSPLPFDHADTGFPLQGMHAASDCMTCHESLVLGDIGSACADCHVDPHAGELGFDCERCHGTLSRDPRFGLEAFHDTTLFPLTGAHRALECGACHRETPPFEYQLTPLECFACHADDYRTATPDHPAAGFSVDCETCHRTDAWRPADIVASGFDHDPFFPLRGAHAPLDCLDCHDAGWTGLDGECFACHGEDYEAARDPDHVVLALSMACEACHSTESWEGATQIDHDAFFPLRGVHRIVACDACHAEGFAGTPRDCVACHLEDYESAADPDHRAGGFALACEDCHGEDSWQVAAIDHDPFFPLRGGHRPLDCADCHDQGFGDTPDECYGCHAADYVGSSNPDHRAAGFPTGCEACHGDSRWEDGVFDHSFFPHVGGHAGLQCEDCHDERYAGNDRRCVACHADDYGATDAPDHAASGYPTACELCHDIFSWESPEVDHAAFPLIQGHGGLECSDCHDPDGFDGTSTECFACHADDYDSAVEPDHSDGFPLTCEDCHGIRGWLPSNFDHDAYYYPIYVSTHADVWETCATCHPDPGDFAFVECLDCHTHNQRDTDASHEGVEDYQYDSQHCLMCHFVPLPR
jgi:hypothetical protein